MATACGVFAMLAPVATLGSAAVFLVAVWVTHYISMGSVLASVTLPVVACATGGADAVVGAATAAAVLIVFRHRSNLGRVRLGTERRVGARA